MYRGKIELKHSPRLTRGTNPPPLQWQSLLYLLAPKRKWLLDIINQVLFTNKELKNSIIQTHKRVHLEFFLSLDFSVRIRFDDSRLGSSRW